MLHANTSSPDIYWKTPDANWQAHLVQCHRNPDILKGPGTMLNQSRYPLHYREVRTSASWKTARTVKWDPFSINIEECTSNNHHKVFSIFISYFDEILGLSVVQNYKSVGMIEVNALTLFQTICNLFQDDQILFENLVSDLSDSTKKVRKVA